MKLYANLPIEFDHFYRHQNLGADNYPESNPKVKIAAKIQPIFCFSQIDLGNLKQIG